MHSGPAATAAREQHGSLQLAPIFIMYIEVAYHASAGRKLVRWQKRAANKMQHSAARAIIQNSGGTSLGGFVAGCQRHLRQRLTDFAVVDRVKPFALRWIQTRLALGGDFQRLNVSRVFKEGHHYFRLRRALRPALATE